MLSAFKSWLRKENVDMLSNINGWYRGLASAFSNDVVCHGSVCLMGIGLSLYALLVEVRKHRNPTYVAACDLGQYASCSRVLTSRYSRGFGVVRYLVGENHMLNLPNCVTGIVFYSIQIILAQLTGTWARYLQFYSCLLSGFGSLYLAYVLAFVLKDLCIVCISTYLVNAYLLYDSWLRLSGQ